MNTSVELLKSHDMLIKHYSWKIAKRWHIDYDEVYSESLLIFCEAVRKYDKKRGAKFSTYLYSQLHQLTQGTKASTPGPHSICYKEHRNRTCLASLEEVENMADDYSLSFIDLIAFWDQARASLSKNAFTLLKFIIKSGREWSLRQITKEFTALIPFRTIRAWQEIKQFWLSYDSSSI